VVVVRQVPTGTRVGLLDVRTGAVSRTLIIPDSLLADVRPVPDGWAWIPAGKDRVRIERAGKTVELAKPAWFGVLERLAVDRGGARVAMVGWNAGSYDSLGVAVAPLAGGTSALWSADAAEAGGAMWLDDGSLLFAPRDTPESVLLFVLKGPGKPARLGRSSRPNAGVSVSADLKRISVVELNYHGDAFTSRIVRR